MVMPQLSLYTSVSLQMKLHHDHEKHPLKLSPIIPSRLFIANLHKKPEHQLPVYLPSNQNVAAIVFGDGSQSRLYPLTKRRSEGAIPIGGNYRLIDAVVSNCINSNITRIYAITQCNSTSLNSHLSRAYSGGLLVNGGFVEVIAAYQSPEDKGWFQGTADAIRRCLWVLEEYPVVEFLVLPGHHLYKMDYEKLIDVHRNNNADITVAVLNSIKDHDPGFGSVKVNYGDQVIEFREKPEFKPIKSELVQSSITSDDFSGDSFPSMGIYIINTNVMVKLLREYFPKANDLKSEIIPGAIALGMKVHAYKFDGYWEDMRNIGAFYQANMESTKKANMEYNFYNRDSPVYTLPRHLPPILVTDASITESVIGDGCILNRCSIRGTVLGPRTRIGDGTVIEDSVIMGSDTYQTDGDQGKSMCIPIGIGEFSYIRKAIVDKNARIGKHVMIINKDGIKEANQEANGYIITEGIIVIVRGAMIPDESIL